LAITVILSVLTVGGLKALFATVMRPDFTGDELVYSMRPLMTANNARLVQQADLSDPSKMAPELQLDAIKKRGMLRVGVFTDRLPFVFLNGAGQLVGFEVEMAQLLARDIGVEVEFVEIKDLRDVSRLLVTNRFDVAMAGMVVTPERIGDMLFSNPYLDETFAFVVKDHLREEFSSWANIRDLGPFTVAIPELPYFVERVRARAPSLKLEIVGTIKQIEDRMKDGTLDAIALPAERGSVLTLLYPKFTVVVPEPGIIKIPLAYPVAGRDQDWLRFINTWIDLKRRDGTVDALYAHWILGKQASKRQPRWSIIHNVLHWMD
jgi:ABC-type amino acid transport substrate-binding protein